MKEGIEDSFTVEGIHYVTGNQVRVLVSKGYIKSITEVEKLEEGNL